MIDVLMSDGHLLSWISFQSSPLVDICKSGTRSDHTVFFGFKSGLRWMWCIKSGLCSMELDYLGRQDAAFGRAIVKSLEWFSGEVELTQGQSRS